MIAASLKPVRGISSALTSPVFRRSRDRRLIEAASTPASARAALDFGDLVIAASLKLAPLRLLGDLLPDFGDLVIAASLKHQATEEGGFGRAHFGDLVIAASLKQGRHCSWHGRASHFGDLVIAASLKQRLACLPSNRDRTTAMIDLRRIRY